MIKLRRSHLPPDADAALDTVTAQDGQVWITVLDDCDQLDFVLPEAFRNAAMPLDSWAV